MSKPRALTLCCCLAALPLIGCAGGGMGAQPQAAALSAPAAAYAVYPGGGRVYAVGSGAPAAIIAMLPAPGDGLTADPALWAAQGFDVVMPPPSEISEIYRIAAGREAALERLVASARTMADAPIWLVGPNPAIEAALAQAPMAGPGQVAGVVVTSVASNAGSCNEKMVYSYSGNGAAPKVTVGKSGNACPPGPAFGGRSNPAVVPRMPATGSHAPRLIEASATKHPGASPSSQRDAVQRVAELIKASPSD